MTDKKTQVRSTEEALKLALESAAGLALEVLKKHRQMKGEYPMGMLGVRAVEELEAVFSEMDEALAEQPAPVAEPHEQQELEELTAQRDQLADILTRTANALKGQPAELSLHSWNDLPEVAQQLKEKNQ